MKRILTFMTLFTLLLTACEGAPGPAGFDGLDGQDGELIVADAFQITDVDFISSDDFQVTFEGFDLIESDVALVYIKWILDDGTITWRQLPQTVFFNNGVLIYNFDFTQDTITFFLDGTIDFNFLDNSWTQNQEFRVVIVPANQVNSVDSSDLNTVMALGNIENFEVK
ncbi:MAG: Uncharacterised protein [Formosa sp. Hel1_33_131]|jgi:hypothetical protein|nr:MAG: Uncharacterised protein [Formosa sp. Hel1_33_131]|tara:strand:+ start:290 stop:793 length:504 start_codon:yes stop_codon:yes gene_type:complete